MEHKEVPVLINFNEQDPVGTIILTKRLEEILTTLPGVGLQLGVIVKNNGSVTEIMSVSIEAQPSIPMHEDCEKCSGTGLIEVIQPNNRGFGGRCPDCYGKGIKKLKVEKDKIGYKIRCKNLISNFKSGITSKEEALKLLEEIEKDALAKNPNPEPDGDIAYCIAIAHDEILS